MEDVNTKSRSGLGMIKTTFLRIRRLLSYRPISIASRKRYTKTYIWSMLPYVSKACTITKETAKEAKRDRNIIMENNVKHSNEKKTNEEVLRISGEKRELV